MQIQKLYKVKQRMVTKRYTMNTDSGRWLLQTIRDKGWVARANQTVRYNILTKF